MTTDPRTWDYQVTTLIRDVDGDTYWLTLQKDIDFGFYMIETKRWSADFRLLGIDAWEKKQPLGPQASADATTWITAAIAANVLRGQTFKTDDFGRWLIDLYRTDTGEHLADYLKAHGDAKPDSPWNGPVNN